MGYYSSATPTFEANRRGSIIGNAAVLKTAARKGLQVRVLSPPPFSFPFQSVLESLTIPTPYSNWIVEFFPALLLLKSVKSV